MKLAMIKILLISLFSFVLAQTGYADSHSSGKDSAQSEDSMQQSTEDGTSTEDMMIDINTATEEELILLKGIGEKKAAAIVKYREENGEFESIEDLVKVKGIGERTLEMNEGRIKITTTQ